MKLFTLFLGAALTIGSALYGQTGADLLNVKMPQPVVVNGVTIPAGDVQIQLVRNLGSMMLTVRAESGEHSTVLVNRSESMESIAGDAKVVLGEKDGTYVLDRIVLPDHTSLNVIN